MAYPEEVPTLSKKDAEKFMERLNTFALTEEQKDFYREAMQQFGKKCPSDCIGRYKISHCVGCYRYPELRDKYERF